MHLPGIDYLHPDLASNYVSTSPHSRCISCLLYRGSWGGVGEGVDLL